MQDYRFLEERPVGHCLPVDTIVRFSQEMQEKVPFLDRAPDDSGNQRR